MRFYITKKKSAKTGKEYIALMAQSECATKILTVDKMTMLELTGMSLLELYALELNEEIELN